LLLFQDGYASFPNLFLRRKHLESLEVLLKKAPTEDTKVLVKNAFADGYVAAGGLTKRYVGVATAVLLLPILLVLAVLYGLVGDRILSTFSREVVPEDVSVNFEDVKGIDDAKNEMIRIVEFLKDPSKFSRLGGRLPKGVILVGPPGTGKTLLAKAIAGEAGVAFFRASGSEFEEMLVGLGAKRVRELFAAARLRAPCVVFIDEIDTIGSKRVSSSIYPYANQTINQLLNEMDGFQSTEGVIVLAATNRREDLDPALMRPGRFDVEVKVGYPDSKGRVEIFKLYLSKIKVNPDIDIELLARWTTGFTGADIENMVNQAALMAAADDRSDVNMQYMESARDFVLMGPGGKKRVPDEYANRITAYHEAGHTVVSYFTKNSVPLHRVTILPHGPSLGHTAYMPEKDQYHVSKEQILATLDTLMGGRAAEDIVFGADKITTGSADDLRKATAIATEMVKQYGMSEKVGLRVFPDSEGFALQQSLERGASTNEEIDSEIKKILQDAYERARSIIKSHINIHKNLAEALLTYETLDAKEIHQVIEGLPLQKAFTMEERLVKLSQDLKAVVKSRVVSAEEMQKWTEDACSFFFDENSVDSDDILVHFCFEAAKRDLAAGRVKEILISAELSAENADTFIITFEV
uniref:AAA domain-containing protein n=1 Tax=Soboliphyme baturini TaxID=241478 RepID=A0A183ITL2_9BILA